MHITVAFSGPAGDGINTVGLLLADYLTRCGYTVLCDKEYASIIKGDNNLFVLYIADDASQVGVSKTIDIYLYFNEFALTKNQTIYTMLRAYKVPKAKELFQNMVAWGLIVRLLDIPYETGKDLVVQTFGQKTQLLERNITSFETGYACEYPAVASVKPISASTSTTTQILFGNEAIACGAHASGADFYSAYPMTPASSLISVFTRFKDVIFFQGEDEIAVAMAMLGAKFAGKRALCGTSGGGFALMTESISFSHQAELGGVYILAQRAGPSTGTPTYTEQADISFALHASFGDTKPIVLAPSTFAEGYSLIGKALNWSDIYQHPVIFLIDKQFAESYWSLDTSSLVATPPARGKLLMTPPADFQRYAESDDGISAYTHPGTPQGEFIATSYEHTASGSTTEDPLIKAAQTQKRQKKLETFVHQEYTDQFFGYEIINPTASKFIITFGANRRSCEPLLRSHPAWGLLLVTVFAPIDPRLVARFADHADSIETLLFVEMNYSGQFETHLRTVAGLFGPQREEKITHRRAYDSYPLFTEDLSEVLGR